MKYARNISDWKNMNFTIYQANLDHLLPQYMKPKP